MSFIFINEMCWNLVIMFSKEKVIIHETNEIVFH